DDDRKPRRPIVGLPVDEHAEVVHVLACRVTHPNHDARQSRLELVLPPRTILPHDARTTRHRTLAQRRARLDQLPPLPNRLRPPGACARVSATGGAASAVTAVATTTAAASTARRRADMTVDALMTWGRRKRRPRLGCRC